MTSASSNTFYARPVFLGGSKSPHAFRNHNFAMEPTMSNSKPTKTLDSPKKVWRYSAEIESSDPPPRPPPPRPCRIPMWKDTDTSPTSLPTTLEQNFNHLHQAPIPEPKPLTRTNVTSHEALWKKDNDNSNDPSDPHGVLSPPMKYITPQTTEEMWKNFDPLDAIDSTSDHSDSSADTMIMMTTEEERKNAEKIDTSLKEYTSVKSKHDGQNTNQLKANIQTQHKKNLHIHFADSNGLVSVWPSRIPNGVSNVDNHSQNLSKVMPLHIKTETNVSSENGVHKSNPNQGCPNDDSPDDGYGTNSSSGTVSSPFSSSFGSGSTDLENSCNGNSKKVILPNGAIKPNSVRESWAVKRKQRMIESSNQDNSVQEQLRQLTIIEEEGHSGNSRMPQGHNSSTYKSHYGINDARKGQNIIENKTEPKSVLKNSNKSRSEYRTSNEIPFVNVSQNDINQRQRQLYVINGETDTYQSTNRVDSRATPHSSGSTNEITESQRVPPPYPTHDYTYATVDRDRRRRRSENADESRKNERMLPGGSSNVNRPVDSIDNRVEDDNAFSSLPSNLNTGPPVLRGGSEQPLRTPSGSGKIYVSPNGDEGFYSLNRSSRSTSMSSFQPISEVVGGANNVENDPNSPRSPLEAISGEMLEKWSDMDRNYRNYYGFDEQREKYSRTDSKINYFQEKKINNMYGQDNYYRPLTYGPDSGQCHGEGQVVANQGTRSLDHRLHLSNSGDTSRSYSMRSAKTSKEGGAVSNKPSKNEKSEGSSKSKLFQILPNLFRPSSKKQNSENKRKNKQKGATSVVIETVSPVIHEHDSLDLEPEAEYMNMGDLPQYSMAYLEQEEMLKKGQYVSVENLQKRPVFASSKDIKKLFSKHDQSFDSINHPGGQRHSFHAMPLSYRHVTSVDSTGDDDMRPRAQSTSATMRSQQIKMSVESRMAVVNRKNAQVMNQARQMSAAASVGNLSGHSGQGHVLGSRSRLDSEGSSGGADPKLSTLV